MKKEENNQGSEKKKKKTMYRGKVQEHTGTYKRYKRKWEDCAKPESS